MKQEKKMSKKTIGIVIGVSVILVAAVVVACIGLNQDFDAGKYVSTILDYTFKGTAKDTEEMFDEKSIVQLENQYEAQMQSFVENSVTGKVVMDATMQEKYTAVCKDIFKAMKYKVKVVHKVSKDEYKVTVEYQISDVFSKYMTAAATEQQKLMDKVERGEYKGTQEEINLQIQTEAIENNYQLLKSAYENMQYEKSVEMIFVVKKGSNEMFALDSEQLSEFIAKIVGLDEIQD